jgi:L-seryl-tRNA(Ser) seleniumtransferase
MPRNASTKEQLRGIPSVDEVLRTEVGMQIERERGRDTALRMARETISELRETDFDGSRENISRAIEAELLRKLEAKARKGLQRAINATGVIIHTNLGRSPLSENAVRSILNAAGYCNVELDLETGERGRRGLSAETLLEEIAGAEDGLIVNNCAAAALLTLSALAAGGEVIVSRGELVEIGGDFRIPDVLERSGSRLREVGTTNRTKLADYERAISGDTKAVLRVHPSNYRITGFTEKPALTDLVRFAHKNDLILIEDAGSGALMDLSAFGLIDEPVIRDSIEAGVDIVTFSGDKLVGGVQAGMIVGRKSLIREIRGNPLYRAVRADKLVYAAVEATLRSFARDSALEEIPTLRMLSISPGEIKARADSFKSRFEEHKRENVKLSLEPGFSAVGGGTGPGVELPTQLISLSHDEMSAKDIAAYFRSQSPPIITRIADGRIILDFRTITDEDEEVLMDAILKLTPIDSPQQSPA